ncbi:MAG: hypothetical protein H0T79_00670 [Deltaproteobacteria bacterium]|nr:hypothetical protein [Deltaproteobacteria bacterium]
MPSSPGLGLALGLALTLSTSLLTACGDDGGTSTPDAATNVGFNKPEMPLHANDEGAPGSWTDLGLADLSCLGTPSADVASAQAITLNTVVKDFQSDTVVAGAMVTAFTGITEGSPFATAVTSDAEGKVTLTIPPGQKRVGFKLVGGAHGNTTQLTTYLLNQYLTPDMPIQTSPELLSVSNETALLLPALIGANRVPGSGVLAGSLRDCQGHEISNFIATVSSTQASASILDGAASYYFAATSSPLPQKQLKASSSNGLYMVIQLPATPTAYVQMWGYKTEADLASDTLSLISELQVPVVADSVVTGSYSPDRI